MVVEKYNVVCFPSRKILPFPLPGAAETEDQMETLIMCSSLLSLSLYAYASSRNAGKGKKREAVSVTPGSCSKMT